MRKAVIGRRDSTYIDYLEEAIDSVLAARSRGWVAPFAEQLALLSTIPGVDRRTAEVLLAECEADMGRFPRPRHLSLLARGAGNNESAGKHGTPLMTSTLADAPPHLVAEGLDGAQTK